MVHKVLQGEEEQGDALMPALFALDQHDALEAIQGRLAQNERHMAFLDDIHALGDWPERQGPLTLRSRRSCGPTQASRCTSGEVTQLWNRAGVEPAGSAALTAAARVADLSAIMWRVAPHFPLEEQGVKILGTPLGHPSCVRSQLVALTAKHEHLISNIMQVQDLQCAWILLLYCPRAYYSLRVVHPNLTDAFAQHDTSMRRALSQRLSVDPSSKYWDVASLPFTRGSRAAWSSWADCSEMIASRNPGVADMFVTKMGQADAGFHVGGGFEVREQLVRVGFNAPQWWDWRAGLRPPGQRVDERHVGIPGHGWQHEATEAVHAHLWSPSRASLWAGSPGWTLLRSGCCCIASGFLQ